MYLHGIDGSGKTGHTSLRAGNSGSSNGMFILVSPVPLSLPQVLAYSKYNVVIIIISDRMVYYVLGTILELTTVK